MLRVLVVDDNRDAAETLSMLVEMLGCEVRTAYDGHEALAVVEVFRPDLVLLDIGMPDISGHDVARRIRANPELADVILAAVTGWGQVRDQQLSRDAGFDYHFVKPADPAFIEQLLSQLEQRRVTAATS